MIRYKNIIDKNNEFRSWWRSISTKSININQKGIEIKQTKNNKIKDLM